MSTNRACEAPRAREITSVLHEEDVAHLLSDLVRTPSYTGLPNQELAVAAKIRDVLMEAGIHSELQEVSPGRPNVIGILDGGLPGSTIVYNAHIDTIPPVTQGMLAGEIRDGRVYGLGATDDKGGACAMLLSLVALRHLKWRFKGRLIFAGVVDEEYKNSGTAKFVETHPDIDFAIVGEPTALDVGVVHRGMEWIDIAVTGKSVHSSRPQDGVNAISKMVDIIVRIRQDLEPCLAERRYPLLGPSLLNLGVIRGGTQPNQIAPDCLLQIERRYNPDETLEQVYQEIEDVLDACRMRDPQLRVTARPAAYSKGSKKGPFSIASDHPLVSAVLEGANAIGMNPRVIGVQYSSDAPLFTSAGIPTVLFGPGDISQAHSAGESIAVLDVVRGAAAYAAIAVTLGSIT